MKPTILFIAENVTLSQVVRLVTLARALDPGRYRVVFACADFDPLVFGGDDAFERRRISSLDPRAVHAALRSGRRLHDEKTLAAQIAEDLALFGELEPDLVVSDFRWSSCVSAPLYGVRHAALVNAYWSPYAVRREFPVPDHPIVRVLGEQLAARYFPRALPLAFQYFAAPVNALRRAHGLPPVGSLLEVLTHGDHVLFADPPELVPTRGAPPNHTHLGYVPWSPCVPLPEWWDALPADRPIVYATVGSSGDVDALPYVIEALASLPVTGIVSTAGRAALGRVPDNVFIADYLPGDIAARRSAVVVTNGGSSTGYQALAEGVPLVGIPSNLDQYLAMTFIREWGAGELVRARSASARDVRHALLRVLDSEGHRHAARRASGAIRRADARERFRHFVDRAVADPPARPRGARARVGALLSVAALGLWSAGAPLAHAEEKRSAAPPALSEIRFSTTTASGNKGHVICALFKRKGWLKAPVQVRKSAISGSEALCVFTRIEPGEYAIVAFHDENDSGDIDKNFLGIPTEDWCTSRNAHGFMGPPSFDAAKFAYKGGIVRLKAHM
jgi:UDP:flavonoid glycosyltransferase YjiC (YdhE family)/uncharacterized protein (DUF2141 family)